MQKSIGHVRCDRVETSAINLLGDRTLGVLPGDRHYETTRCTIRTRFGFFEFDFTELGEQAHHLALDLKKVVDMPRLFVRLIGDLTGFNHLLQLVHFVSESIGDSLIEICIVSFSRLPVGVVHRQNLAVFGHLSTADESTTTTHREELLNRPVAGVIFDDRRNWTIGLAVDFNCQIDFDRLVSASECILHMNHGEKHLQEAR